MPFLVDIVKEAYNVYIQMEASRYFTSMRPNKSPILKDFFDRHLQDNDNIALAKELDSLVIKDLKIANDAKLTIILNILKHIACLTLHQTPIDNLDDLEERYKANFDESLADRNYFLCKIHQYISEVKAETLSNTRLDQTASLLAEANAKVAQLSTELKTLQNDATKNEKENTLNKLQQQQLGLEAKIKALEKALDNANLRAQPTPNTLKLKEELSLARLELDARNKSNAPKPSIFNTGFISHTQKKPFFNPAQNLQPSFNANQSLATTLMNFMSAVPQPRPAPTVAPPPTLGIPLTGMKK